MNCGTVAEWEIAIKQQTSNLGTSKPKPGSIRSEFLTKLSLIVPGYHYYFNNCVGSRSFVLAINNPNGPYYRP